MEQLTRSTSSLKNEPRCFLRARPENGCWEFPSSLRPFPRKEPSRARKITTETPAVFPRLSLVRSLSSTSEVRIVDNVRSNKYSYFLMLVARANSSTRYVKLSTVQ